MKHFTFAEDPNTNVYVLLDEAQAEIDEWKKQTGKCAEELVDKQAEIAELKKENKFITEGSNRALKMQQAEIDKAIELLDAAFCPCCDKSDAYYGSLSFEHIANKMGEVFQCQWCDEVEALKNKGE
jgi:hypothetical protein